jgi:hypothetical protein
MAAFSFRGDALNGQHSEPSNFSRSVVGDDDSRARQL